MSSSNLREEKFNFGKIDWEEYEAHRPPYPDELYSLIFKHHQDHNGHWDTALDVGAGGGTVTNVLRRHFQHIICTDAAAGYVEQAAERFSADREAGRVSILKRKFGDFELETDLPRGQPVDMITAGTCIHFGEPAKLMAQLAPLIRPGGTIAAFTYGSIPILPPGDPSRSCVIKIKDMIIEWIHNNVRPLDQIEATGTGQARYRNVEFDPAVWIDVRRITSLVNEPIWPRWVQAASSRARDDVESTEVVADDFITRKVGYDFFPGYFRNLAPGFDVSDLIREDLDVLKNTLGDREILVKWPLIAVVASKR